MGNTTDAGTREAGIGTDREEGDYHQEDREGDKVKDRDEGWDRKPRNEGRVVETDHPYRDADTERPIIWRHKGGEYWGQTGRVTVRWRPAPSGESLGRAEDRRR